MGRPRKKPIDEFIEQPSEAELSAEIEYQDFLSTLGDGNVAVTIHRFPKFGNVMEWCGNPPLQDATLEAIKENHGPGKYKLSFRGPTGFLGSKVVCIAGDFKDTKTTGGNSHLTAETFMQQQLVMQQNLMAALMTGMKAPDVGGMMAGLAAVMTAMKPAENGTKPVDPLAMFQSILTMYQSLRPKEEKSELDRLRDTAAVIKEFSSDSKGIDGPWDAVASVGKDVVEKLAPVLTGMAGAKMPAPNGSAAPGRPAGAAVTSGALPPSTADGVPAGTALNPDENLRQWIATQIAFLKQKALAGKDPGFWIDYIFENAEEPGCQAMLYAIRQGATFEHLLAFDAEIGQNPMLTSWFREVFNGVQSGLQADVDSRGESRDTGDTPPNGSAGPAGHNPAGNPGTRTAVS